MSSTVSQKSDDKEDCFFFSDKHRNNAGTLKQFEDDLRHCLEQDRGHICVKKEHDCDDDNESVAESVASSGLESRAGDSDAEVVHLRMILFYL